MKKILEYWLSIEMLRQDGIIKKPPKYNKSLFGINDKTKHFTYFSNWITKNNLLGNNYDTVSKFLTVNDDIKHVICGKVKRQNLIDEIEKLHSDEIEKKIPENSLDYICVFTYKTDSNDRLIAESVEVSPIIWALRRLKDDRASRIRLDDYVNFCRVFEKKLFTTEKIINDSEIIKICDWFKVKIIDELLPESEYESGILKINTAYKSETEKELFSEAIPDYSNIMQGYYYSDLFSIFENSSNLKKSLITLKRTK